MAKIQQNGVWSNAKGFTVPVPGGNTLVPNVVTMMVGDTRNLQALSASGQPATGLTWTSSDPTKVSLSSDDPPLLTALGADGSCEDTSEWRVEQRKGPHRAGTAGFFSTLLRRNEDDAHRGEGIQDVAGR
jgi:hypothetical protein